MYRVVDEYYLYVRNNLKFVVVFQIALFISWLYGFWTNGYPLTLSLVISIVLLIYATPTQYWTKHNLALGYTENEYSMSFVHLELVKQAIQQDDLEEVKQLFTIETDKFLSNQGRLEDHMIEMLTVAVQFGRRAIVHYLLHERGAVLTKKRPIYKAIEYGQLDILYDLLEAACHLQMKYNISHDSSRKINAVEWTGLSASMFCAIPIEIIETYFQHIPQHVVIGLNHQQVQKSLEYSTQLQTVGQLLVHDYHFPRELADLILDWIPNELVLYNEYLQRQVVQQSTNLLHQHMHQLV